jgi:hypothetical protein
MSEPPADVIETRLAMIRQEVERDWPDVRHGPKRLARMDMSLLLLRKLASDARAAEQFGMHDLSGRIAAAVVLALEGMEAHARCRCRREAANDDGDGRGFGEIEAIMAGENDR